MKAEELKQIALAAARNIKTQQELSEFQRMLTRVMVEAALNAERDDHPGYECHEKSDESRGAHTLLLAIDRMSYPVP